MIHLSNLCKSYRTRSIETLALHNINLHVEAGEFVSVMGPSGCGKSTMLNIMGLLDQPTSGEINIGQQKTGNLSNRQLAQFRNRELGFVFQSYHLIGDLSVIDNVEVPLIYRSLSRKERKRKATEALERVGLLARINHFPDELSGGQRQRVAVARAIVGQPKVLLADEPTGNLDSAMGQEILGILKQLNEEMGTTIVMVTHDEKMANETHRLIRLFDGNLVEEQTAINSVQHA